MCPAIKHIAYIHPCRIHTSTQRDVCRRSSQFVDPIRLAHADFLFFNNHLKVSQIAGKNPCGKNTLSCAVYFEICRYSLKKHIILILVGFEQADNSAICPEIPNHKTFKKLSRVYENFPRHIN